MQVSLRFCFLMVAASFGAFPGWSGNLKITGLEGFDFTYLVPHVPATDRDWVMKLKVMNTNYEIVDLRIESYTHSGESGSYVLSETLNHSVLPYQVSDLAPLLKEAPQDRWFRIYTTKPLDGWVSFFQKSQPKNQTVLPLQDATPQPGPRYFAHVPSDRGQFWSGFSIVNLGEPGTVLFNLWSAKGQNLNHLLKPGQESIVLQTLEKRLSLFEGQLFDDAQSPEKVAWVQMDAGPDIHGLALFGRQTTQGLGDLAGQLVTSPLVPEQLQKMPLRRQEGITSGLVLVNPGEENQEVRLNLIGTNGAVLDTVALPLAAKEKGLASWTLTGLQITPPSGPPVVIPIEQLQELARIDYQASGDLLVLQLDFRADGQLEGVLPPTESTYLATANLGSGSSEIYLENPSQNDVEVDLWGIHPNGERRYFRSLRLMPGEIWSERNFENLPENSYLLAIGTEPILFEIVSVDSDLPFFQAKGVNALPEVLLPDPYSLSVPKDPEALEIPGEWVQWLEENAKPLASLQANTFEDLQFLHNAIGNRNIIQLGESSHGAREFNQAKVRVIKFLHQQMGVNVIAFESGFFECENARRSQSLSTGERLMWNTIFAVWSTNEVVELFDYILKSQSTSRPLIISGFDHQISSYSGSLKRIQVIRDFLAPLDSTLNERIQSIEQQWYNASFDLLLLKILADDAEPLYRQAVNLVQRILETELSDKEREKALFFKGVFLSMVLNINAARFLNSGGYSVVRDAAMAELLEFLAEERYPNQKIAVWAHNGHIMHDSDMLEPDVYGLYPVMGTIIERKFRADVYTIGLYMYRGVSALNIGQPLTVLMPETANSLEAILHSATRPYLFIDMLGQQPTPGNSWMTQETPRILSRVWGGPWIEGLIPKLNYDAILFIDETHMPSYRFR